MATQCCSPKLGVAVPTSALQFNTFPECLPRRRVPVENHEHPVVLHFHQKQSRPLMLAIKPCPIPPLGHRGRVPTLVVYHPHYPDYNTLVKLPALDYGDTVDYD